MIEIDTIAQLPQLPSVYAMYGGRIKGLHVAYVGIADSLKDRIIQHLIRRDSSVATGTSAAALLPDHVTEVRWWYHSEFENRTKLQAAEIIAFDVLNPALRSRAPLQNKIKKLLEDADFKRNMIEFFTGLPTGRLVLRTVEVAFERIQLLEKRITELEIEVRQLKNSP